MELDLAGAITELHGRTVFHDWLGRPVLVAEIDDTVSPAAVDPVVAFKYDGFGRLAQRIAPWPNTTKDWQRIETYYYDGVRRIQEHFHDPVQATPPWPVQGGGGGIGGSGGGNPPTAEEHRTEAEYIWSAASGQPFDTCHVQIDWWDREAWFVQDHATGTVRGYTDAHGEVVRECRMDVHGSFMSREGIPSRHRVKPMTAPISYVTNSLEAVAQYCVVHSSTALCSIFDNLIGIAGRSARFLRGSLPWSLDSGILVCHRLLLPC